MRNSINLLKTAIVKGFFSLLPVLLILLILDETFVLISDVLGPFAGDSQGIRFLGMSLTSWLVLLGIPLLFMTVGFISQTKVGARIGMWFDENIMSHMPGYRLLKSVSEQFGGSGQEILLSPALFRTDMDTWMFAFILDEWPGEYYSLFVPTAPTPMMGTVQYVKKERVRKVDIPPAKLIDNLMKWGIDSKSMFDLQKHIKDD